MTRKPSTGDTKLRDLIRRIVKEELAKMAAQHPERNWLMNPEHSESRSGNHSDKRTKSELHPEYAEWEDGPWAVFGPPEPDPSHLSRYKQQKPPALPDWSAPYHPDFNHFEAPPYTPKSRRKR
ncbi:hypothetical protein [Lihuaxuella thermophila]|uniref:Uncharacterized protein n=1 Tax=Lihuaxuella thermophila TaxID=1173111 RepID=A0A1H8DAL6_9BACL|nr:hypothetical protein [Lihuaxuella thermophila]SEN04299.1 hypothetical protein SAMN05444955_10582 [Lihuaxuella thermophila]